MLRDLFICFPTSPEKLVVTDFLFLSGMTLAGSRSVVSNAHIPAFIFFTAFTLSRSRSVVRQARVQVFAQKLALVLDSLARTCKERELWARPPVLAPVPSQAIHSSSPVAVGSRRVDSLVCEGDGDVAGVVTLLRGVAQVVLHGVQVVEVGVLLRVHQDRGVEEDGEGQVEVEKGRSRGQGETLMCEDGMK